MQNQWSMWAKQVRYVAMAVVAVAVVSTANTAWAEGPMGRTFGLGLALGNPTSMTGKYHLSQKEAIDFHVGVFHVYGDHFWNDSLFLGGDYLFEIWNFAQTSTVNVPFYAGPGLGLTFDLDDDHCGRDRRPYCDDYDFGFGPRLPIGVGVEFEKAPFEIFIETTPSLMFVYNDYGDGGDLDVDIDIPNFALIGRFYF